MIMESNCLLPYAKSPFSLQHFALEVTTSALLQKMVQHSGEEGDDSYLDSNRPTFEDYLLAHIPLPLHDVLCVKLLQLFDETSQNVYWSLFSDGHRTQWQTPKAPANRLVRECQTELARVRSQRLQTLRMRDLPSSLHSGFIQQFAPFLTGLRSLDMTGRNIGLFYEMSASPLKLKRVLHQMPLLEEFIMPVDGGLVVDVLADCCPLLRRLDVSLSREVLDKHVPVLAALDRLQEVQLHGTAFTELGYARLLRAMPQLHDMGSDSRLIRRALHLSSYDPVDWGRFCEEQIVEKQPVEVRTSARLQLVVRSYPSVQCVTIRGGGVYLRHLPKLTRIEALKLVDFGFKRVRDALRWNWNWWNLRQLTLEGVDCVNSWSELCDLSVLCPWLKELVLICVPRKSGWIDERPSHTNAKRTCGHVQQIKRSWLNGIIRLQLECENASLVEYLLTNCVLLRKLQISSRLLQTGAMVERVLARNPMSRLKQASLGPDVPLETARNLVKSCGRVQMLRLTYRGEESVRARYEGFREEVRAEKPDGVQIFIEDELTEMFELFELMDESI